MERDTFVPEKREILTDEKRSVLPQIGPELFYAGIDESQECNQLLTDPCLVEQATFRRNLHGMLEALFQKMPNPQISIEDLVKENVCTEADIVSLWSSLGKFLGEDDNNSRILLYLPTSLLPIMHGVENDSETMRATKEAFAESYRANWIRILHETESRANFVDGDILEPGLGEVERVAKAGHLLPQLLEKGIFSEEEVVMLLDIIQDETIVRSLTEGIMVAHELGHLTDEKLEVVTDLLEAKGGGIDTLQRVPSVWNDPESPEISAERRAWLLSVQNEKQREVLNNEMLVNRVIGSADLSAPIQYSDQELAEAFPMFIQAADKIKTHPVLADALYPTFLVYGSRMKGYADQDADTDTAIIFKPEVKREERDAILEMLHRDIPEIEPENALVEFWTERNDGIIVLQNPLEETRREAGEDQIHFLLGGAFIGSDVSVETVRDDIAANYLDLSRFGDQKEQKRQQYLGQLELDILQYRLMHKGYRKLYPLRERETLVHGDLIDWESDFWDPGYRQVATKLFLSRVFLPDLS